MLLKQSLGEGTINNLASGWVAVGNSETAGECLYFSRRVLWGGGGFEFFSFVGDSPILNNFINLLADFNSLGIFIIDSQN